MVDDDSKQQSVRASVSLPAEDYAELEAIARDQRVSLAWVVRDAVTRYLDGRRPLFANRNGIEGPDAVEIQSH